MGDILTRIMEMQAEFQQRTPDGVTESFKETTPEKVCEMVRTQTLACIKELTEALDEVGWKPWASSRYVNVEAFRSELIDAFRFWLNLIYIAGLSPDGVLNYYEQSLAKTNARIDNGYDGVSTKCPGCKRDYGDPGVMCHPQFDSTVDQPIEPTPAYCAAKSRYVSASGEYMNLGETGWYVDAT